MKNEGWNWIERQEERMNETEFREWNKAEWRLNDAGNVWMTAARQINWLQSALIKSNQQMKLNQLLKAHWLNWIGLICLIWLIRADWFKPDWFMKTQ